MLLLFSVLITLGAFALLYSIVSLAIEEVWGWSDPFPPAAAALLMGVAIFVCGVLVCLVWMWCAGIPT